MRFITGIMALTFLAFAGGCNTTEQASNPNNNGNANLLAQNTTTRPGPDNSEITTVTDANGVRTETRVFRDNRRVSRVVVTTRDGRQTVRVVSRSGEEKEANNFEHAMDATGDAIADAAGFVGDKTEDVAGKTVDTGKTVGEKTAEGAKAVGEKTAEGAKTVGKATAKGAKKTGEALKKVIP